MALKAAPDATGEGKAKAPFAEIPSFSPLTSSTRPTPASPLTVPPTRKELVVQVMATEVTLALATVPLPPLTEQTCVGPLGCVETVTLKPDPEATATGKVKLPFAETLTLSAPLFLSTRPLPASPLTVPPTW